MNVSSFAIDDYGKYFTAHHCNCCHVRLLPVIHNLCITNEEHNPDIVLRVPVSISNPPCWSLCEDMSANNPAWMSQCNTGKRRPQTGIVVRFNGNDGNVASSVCKNTFTILFLSRNNIILIPSLLVSIGFMAFKMLSNALKFNSLDLHGISCFSV